MLNNTNIGDTIMKATKGMNHNMRSIPQSEVTCGTWKYRVVSGHEPKGLGDWAFAFNLDGSDIRYCCGLFSFAKREAMKQAAREGISKIYVLP